MTSNEIFILNTVLWAILSFMGMFKHLRNNQTILTLLVISALYGCVSVFVHIFISRMDDLSSYSFWSPFVYLVLYGFLRYLYLKIYHREPTYNKASWYDPEEGRNQNTLDLLAHLLPMGVSLIFPFLVKKLLSSF